jgi:hypothetical protein
VVEGKRVIVDAQISKIWITGWRHYLSIGVGALMLVWFFYGMFEYSDGPIHPCREHGYCGKQGQPHTQTEFEHFTVWKTALFSGWPVGMLSVFLLRREQFRWSK